MWMYRSNVDMLHLSSKCVLCCVLHDEACDVIKNKWVEMDA